MGNPRTRVSNLAVTRDGNNIKATWKIPVDLSQGDYKADTVDIRFNFDRTGVSLTQTDVWYGPIIDGRRPLSYTAADRFWVRGTEYHQSGLATETTKNYDRNRFHPVSAGKYLRGVSVGVAGWKNNDVFGPWTWVTYGIGLPRAPKVTWDYNANTHVAKAVVETDEGKDNYERYDTVIRVSIRKQDGKEASLMGWSSTKSTKWEKSWDLSSYILNLHEGQWVSIRCWAYARGMAGDNPAQANAVYASKEVVFPVSCTPGEVTCDKKEPSGRIRVPVTGNGWPCTVQLQRRKGESGTFSDVQGSTDNLTSGTIGLYDSYGAVDPAKGEYTYYRIKTTRDNFVNYSKEVRADCIYTAKPPEICNATCKLASLTTNAAGNQVSVVMAWRDSSENDGVELSWSQYENGWATSEQPNTLILADSGTGAVAPDNPTKLEGWTTKTYSISGLSSGQVYYVRMRRYKDYADTGHRIFSVYDIEDMATAVKTESAEDDECGIAEAAVDGTTATLTIGINEDNENTGTEVTWADHEDAWMSNEQPASFNATWPRESSTSADWDYMQTVYLRGLDAGRTYWVKARRYLEGSGGTSFTPYSKTKPVTIPAGAAANGYDLRCNLVSVEPGADGRSAVVVIGWDGDHTGCEASWSKDPDAWQSSGQPSAFEYEWIDEENKSGYYFKTTDTAVVQGKTYYTRTGSGTAESPYVYTAVSNPATADIGTYYEFAYAWSHTSTCYLTDLDEGETYYVKGRSYYDGDDKAWSEYTTAIAVTPYSAPASVALSSNSAVVAGNPIECWWSIESEMEQQEWHIHRDGYPLVALAEGTGSLCRASIPADKYEGLDAITVYVEAGCGGGLTRSNNLTISIVEIPTCEVWCESTATAQPVEFKVYTDDAGARLMCSCYAEGISYEGPAGPMDQVDGDTVWTGAMTPTWTEIEWSDTDLYDSLSDAKDAADAAETAAQAAFDETDEAAALEDAEDDMALKKAAFDLTPEAQALAQLTPQDLEYAAAYVAAWSTAEGVAYAASITAHEEALDAAAAIPEGIALAGAQAAAEAADAALDAHPADGTAYEATVEMPVSDLYDEGSYRFTAWAVEQVANLSSEPSTVRFSVAYAHQAPTPSNDIMLTVDAEKKTVVVELAQPTGYAEGDVYDIYRLTPWGYDLVMQGLSPSGIITDSYAPFGKADLHYRIAARTADGDIAWKDFPYKMDASVLRFDWDGGSAEFPYNIELREGFEKSFETRSHVDGSTNGYWDKGTVAKGSYSTDIIKFDNADLLRLARQVGSVPGALWVRDSHGKAMQCDVELNEASMGYSGKLVRLAFSITAVKLTDQFKPKNGRPTSDVGDVEEEEGA